MKKFSVTVKETRQYLVTYLVEANDQSQALAKVEQGDYEDVEQDNYDYTLSTDWGSASIKKIGEEKQTTIGGEQNGRV